MALIERRSLLAYGYQGTAKAVRFFSGLVWGFIALSAFVLILWKAHLLAFDGELLHGSDILKYALGWGLVVPDGRLLRGIDLAGLSAIHADPRHRFLVGSAAAFAAVWIFPRHKSGRDAGRVICGSSRRPGFLPQPLVHGIAVVGGWFPRQLGLGGILFLWHVRQRAGSARTLVRRAPHRPTAVERRHHWPRRQPAGFVLLVIAAMLMWLWWGRRVQSPFRSSGWKPHGSESLKNSAHYHYR